MVASTVSAKVGPVSVGPVWWGWSMPRRRDPDAVAVVHRTARIGLRTPRPGSGGGASGCCARPGTCGPACWRSTGGGAAAARHPWPATRSCVGSLPRQAPVRSASSTAWVPGRCCAGIRTRGFRRPNAARQATVRCGFHGGGVGCCRCASTTAPSGCRGLPRPAHPGRGSMLPNQANVGGNGTRDLRPHQGHSRSGRRGLPGLRRRPR
jgi:hypothetical protein